MHSVSEESCTYTEAEKLDKHGAWQVNLFPTRLIAWSVWKFIG